MGELSPITFAHGREYLSEYLSHETICSQRPPNVGVSFPMRELSRW
jgi:hypothetical protein